MEWVSRVVRSASGGLRIEVAMQTGERVVKELDAFAGDTPRNDDVAFKGVITLASLARGCTRAYLEGLGLHLDSAPRQSVYEVEVCGCVWVIPSQVLVMMLFASRRAFRERLLTPCSPCTLDAELSAEKARFPAIAARLAWMLASPSATRAWASVYRNAIDGRFEMSMPDATVEVVASGRLVGGKFLVTHGRLLALHAHDLASDMSDAQRSHSLLGAKRIGSDGFRTTVSVDSDARLSNWTPSLRLTDATWSVIQPHVAPSGRRPGVRRHDARTVTETMLTKLGCGLTWAEVPGDRLLVGAASTLFQKLRHQRTLDAVILAASRQ